MTALRRASALLVALLLATIALVATPMPARAENPLQYVRIDLTQITPDSLDKDATVTIRGRITNTSRHPLGWVSIALWRDYYPITSQEDLAWVLAAPPEAPGGSRMTAEGSYVNLNSDASPTVAAGASTDFVLRAKVADLHLADARDGSVHLLGVHVRGIPHGGENQTLARVRFVMPWKTQTRQVAPVVMLSSLPSRAVDGSFTDDHLARELRGRLERLLQVAELPGASAVVDPALVDALQAMSKGYTVDGVQVRADDPRAEDAKSWLARLLVLRDSGRLHRTPWGNPNIALMLSTRNAAMVQRAADAMPATHLLAATPLAIWPQSGGLGEGAEKFFSPLRPQLWLEPATGSSRHERADGSIWVRHLPGLLDGGPGPDPRASLPQRRSRLLSQIAITGGTTVLPVRTDAEAQAVLSLPAWVETRSIDDIAITPTPQPRPASVVRLDRGLATALEDSEQAVLDWTDLQADDTGGRRASAQLASAALHPDLTPAAARDWLVRATHAVPGQFGAGVSLSIAPSFVMGDRTTTLPVTIHNGTGHTVRVKVVMRSDNTARITIPDTRLVTIAPGQSATVNFRPEATTNGVVGFTARMETQRGIVIGQPRRFSINATSFGRVAWIIIIASGAVLLGGTAMRIKQVQRERARAQQAPVPQQRRADITARPHP